MNPHEQLLLTFLKQSKDRNVQAILLQSFIAEYGPLSEAAAVEVRALLSGEEK